LKLTKLNNLHNHAVDFPKTGIPADIKSAPTTKSRPDFMYRPQYTVKTGYYKSSRVMGLMYRDDELNHLLEQSYQSGTFNFQSPETDPIWKFVRSKTTDDWEKYLDAALKYQYTFEAELDGIASYCRPKLLEIELWTGYINMEGKKSHRGLFSLEEWARDQFSSLLLKTEKLMVGGGKAPMEVLGLAAASYYISNVVKSNESYGNVFGYLLFHHLAEV
ncbi:hypothetical protein BDR26DRAFT_501982, partial [Obelidium mucronatum]